MTSAMRATRYLHTIHAAESCERLRHIYCWVFGGICFAENYYAPEDRDMALLYVGDHMIEVMSPRHADRLEYQFARFLKSMGPSYHSISFAVADSDAALAACQAKGISISTTGPKFFFVHPKSTGGVIMEITDNPMPNDPWVLPNWNKKWAAGRPEKPHGLAHIVCVPRNSPAAIAFFTEMLGGVAGVPYTVDWPQAATVTPIDIADATILIMEPDREAGPLGEFAGKPNSGVFALAWQVEDPAAAAAWFAENDVPMTPLAQSAPYRYELLLDGVRHWFA